MNIYERNYWSLYLDFIDSFKGLTYDGFSLPYLCHFRSLIRKSDNLLERLSSKSIGDLLINEVDSSRDIQTVFNHFTEPYTKKELIKNSKGKVLIHDVYNLIRFPSQILKKHFDPSNTVLLKERKRNNLGKTKRQRKIKYKKTEGRGDSVKELKDPSGIPVIYFDKYNIQAQNISVSIKQVQKQARKVFNSFNEHPLFNNKNFQELFLHQINVIINRIEESRKLLRSISVSCIILSSTHYPESRTLALVAAEQGIPTICMQHGIISSEFGYLPKIASIDAVYGNFELAWYKEKGVSDQSIEIIGHPRFDQIFTRNPVSRSNFEKELGLDPKKKTVLIVVRGKKDMERWRVIIQALLKKGIVNVVVKDFPSSKPHKLTEEFSTAYSTGNFHLYDILHNVDAVVVYSSTVGLESMLADKPTFVLNDEFPGHTGYYYLLNELCENNPNQLAGKVIKYFEEEGMEEYANQVREEFLMHAYPDVTMSGKRLKELINRLTIADKE